MIILSDTKNQQRTIQISLSDIIHESTEVGKRGYTVVLPLVVCKEKKDAEYIQQKVNTFVDNLCKEVLEK